MIEFGKVKIPSKFDSMDDRHDWTCVALRIVLEAYQVQRVHNLREGDQ